MPARLTIAELQKYPQSAWRREPPTPTTDSRCAIGVGRNRPCTLHYRQYGNGAAKIIWISGHGAGMEDFYRHVEHFGVERGDRYTCVLFENRGVGASEAAWSFPPMVELARDVLELLDHLGWKGERSVHIVGHSMGGMIAQEIGLLEPSRVASLTLISTTSHWLKDLSLLSAAKSTLSALVPKSADAKLAETAQMLFGDAWLCAPDEVTPGVFPTNYDAWAAGTFNQTVNVKGAIIQARACVRHYVKPEDLKALGENVRGSRIQVVHGRADVIVPFSAAERTHQGLGGDAAGVKLHLFDLVGHMAPIERLEDVISMLEEIILHSQELPSQYLRTHVGRL